MGAKLAAIGRAGLAAATLHPLRSTAAVVCIVALLVPFLAGSAIARGLLDQAEASLRHGADLYVTGTRFGRPAPLPVETAEALAGIHGVRDVTPRIVGETAIGQEAVEVIVVGVPAGRVPESARFVEGRPFQDEDEVVLGTELARRLAVRPGSLLPPFYDNPRGQRVTTVTGVFEADAPLWQAHVMLCSLETASRIFDQDGLATSFLLRCHADYAPEVAAAIRRLEKVPGERGPVALDVAGRDTVRNELTANLRHLDGVFHLHFVLAFAVGIPLLMVASGVGLSERRREAALRKAIGWMTDEVLLLGLVESLVLSVLGASLALLLAFAWLALLDGAGLASVFVLGAPASFPLPFRFLPEPALLGYAVSFAVVATGTLYATWRAAVAEPALALR